MEGRRWGAEGVNRGLSGWLCRQLPAALPRSRKHHSAGLDEPGQGEGRERTCSHSHHSPSSQQGPVWPRYQQVRRGEKMELEQVKYTKVENSHSPGHLLITWKCHNQGEKWKQKSKGIGCNCKFNLIVLSINLKCNLPLFITSIEETESSSLFAELCAASATGNQQQANQSNH